MITFSYQARDAAGRIVSGIQEALNEDNAVTSLMSRGLMVLSLQRKATASQLAQEVYYSKRDRSCSLYPAALDHDRGRYFPGASFDRLVRTG